MNEEIIIDIAPNGDVSVEGVNIAGPECMKLTAEIEKALGTTMSVKKKPDFFRANTPKMKRGN